MNQPEDQHDVTPIRTTE